MASPPPEALIGQAFNQEGKRQTTEYTEYTEIERVMKPVRLIFRVSATKVPIHLLSVYSECSVVLISKSRFSTNEAGKAPGREWDRTG
jgi:hypothetical protein